MNSAKNRPGRPTQEVSDGVPRETPEVPNVSRETAERLGGLLDLVRRWNPVVNLVGRSEVAVLDRRHLADSLRILPLLPAGLDRAIDLGSGGGFPGLVLAIASGAPFDLIESDQRKAAFLAEAAMRLAAPARVVARRIEDAQVAPARVITARALAPLPKLLALAAPLLAPQGECLFLKGREVHAEIEAAEHEWDFDYSLLQGAAPESGAVLRVGSIARRAGTLPSRGPRR